MTTQPTVDLSNDALVKIEGGEVVTWEEAKRRLTTASPQVGGDDLLDAADKAHRACMSAWSCGEPYHRVKTMMDAVEHLGVVVLRRKEKSVIEENIFDLMKNALVEHDKNVAECPIDGERLQRDTSAECVRCGATSSESCGVKVGAAHQLIKTVRGLMDKHAAETND